MKFMRILVSGTFALAVLFGTGSPAAAEGGDEQQAVEQEMFKEVSEAYRLALAELRQICATEEVGRSFRGTSQCMRGIKELRSFIKEAREQLHDLAKKVHEERKAAEEKAREDEKRAHDEQKAKLEEEKAKLEEEKRAFERAKEEKKRAEHEQKDREKQAAKDKEREKEKQAAKDKEKQSEVAKSADLEKKRAYYRTRLAALEELIAFKWTEAGRFDELVKSLRAAAEKAVGAERERLLAKAEDADRSFADFVAWARKYEAEQKEITAALERLGKTTPVVVPVHNDLSKKIAKLEQRKRELEGVVTYKMGLHDEMHAKADEYEQIAAGLTGTDRDKYLRKAADADRQADEWERLAKEYQSELDAVCAEIDKLKA